MIRIRFLLAMLVLVASPPLLRAQSLTIHGIGGAERVMTLGEIEALGAIEVKDSREITIEGQNRRIEIRYGGVPLRRILEAAGIEQLDRYRIRAATILLTARDGYRASFSWGELFNNAVGASVMVIFRENGERLPARDGDFTLRSFSDTRPGPRHVRLLQEIRVILPE